MTTTHPQSHLFGLVDKKKWVFSRVGSRLQTATEPEHGEAIVAQPFKTVAIGKPRQEFHNPKWGEPLDVMFDCGHIAKVLHQDVLDGKIVPCPVCLVQSERKAAKKKATRQRQADRAYQQWKIRFERTQQERWAEEHNRLERMRRRYK